jgi:hypothetical protein
LSCEINCRAFSANSGQFDAGIDDDRLELLAHHAALRVDLVDRHQRHVLQHRLADRHRAGQRVKDADLDRVGGDALRCDRQARDGERGGGQRQSLQNMFCVPWIPRIQ